MSAIAVKKSHEPETGSDLLSRLRFAILSLEFSPGEVISERVLEQRFSASRTPIREALFSLVRDGLVVKDDRRYVIAPFDLAEIEDVFAFRDIVEPAAIRCAAKLATAEQIETIRKDMDFSHRKYAPERWLEMGLDFHVRCARLSQNRYLVAALEDITLRTVRARWISFSSAGKRSATYREHKEILDFIAAGDADAAVKAVLEHSAAVKSEVLAAIVNARRIMGRRSVVTGESIIIEGGKRS